MSETYVVVSKVKKKVKESGYRTGKDYTDALSRQIEQIVESSVQKVKTEGKKNFSTTKVAYGPFMKLVNQIDVNDEINYLKQSNDPKNHKKNSKN